MAKITFYEKTGCINNTKQKKILELAGHQVKAIDLIKYKWTEEELLSFFKKLPIDLCFNKNAPRVQSGEVIPDRYTCDQAIRAMLDDHLLIRRPLLKIGENKLVGFDKEKIDELVGIIDTTNAALEKLLDQNLEDCPQKAKSSPCE